MRVLRRLSAVKTKDVRSPLKQVPCSMAWLGPKLRFACASKAARLSAYGVTTQLFLHFAAKSMNSGSMDCRHVFLQHSLPECARIFSWSSLTCGSERQIFFLFRLPGRMNIVRTLEDLKTVSKFNLNA